MPTILIVDDKSSIRKPLAALIKSAGHQVYQAADAHEALAMARHERPDLIVSDVVMPGMDGFELIRQLRADPILGDTKAIFYTSMYTEEEARVVAADCRAFRLINKSARLEVLLEAIESALRLSPVASSAQSSAQYHQEHNRLVGNKLWQNTIALEATMSRFESLISFGQRLAAERNFRRLLSGFCDEVKIILRTKYAAVGMIEDRGLSNYMLALGGGDRCRMIDPGRVPEFLKAVVKKQKSVRFAPQGAALWDFAKLIKTRQCGQSIRDVLAVPIATASSCFGWLCIASKNSESDGREFDEADERIAEMLAAQLALAIENRRQVRIIRRHTRELELRVRERTAELQRSNTALEHFAHDAAHDLQAPLDTIAGYLERLIDPPVAQLDGEWLASMNAAIAAAGRMRQLIRDVLHYSQLNGAIGPITLTDSGAALTRAMDNLAINIIKSGASVTWDRLPHLYVDSAQLTQVFQNLIQNAITYCRAEQPRVHIAAQRRGGQDWLFSVKDNGIGIEHKDLSRIFNLFQRLHGNDHYPGNGIGLAACKKLIEGNSGRIWVESKPGEGSTFYFTLLKSPRGTGRAAA